jgi:hypothetical protein
MEMNMCSVLFRQSLAIVRCRKQELTYFEPRNHSWNLIILRKYLLLDLILFSKYWLHWEMEQSVAAVVQAQLVDKRRVPEQRKWFPVCELWAINENRTSQPMIFKVYRIDIYWWLCQNWRQRKNCFWGSW